MSTWGSYFTSIVSKKPAGEGDAPTPTPTTSTLPTPPTPENPNAISVTKVEAQSAVNAPSPAPATTIPTKPTSPLPRKPTDGYQRANPNSSARKLYDIPKEPLLKEVLAAQNPNSSTNASRVAKMFGYAANAYVPPAEESKPTMPIGISPMKAIRETPSPSSRKIDPESYRPLSPIMAMVQAAENRGSVDPELYRPFSPIIAMAEVLSLNRTDPPPSLKAKVDATAPKKSEPKVMPIVDAVLRYKRDNKVVPVKLKSKKDEVQEMLDFFASQLDAPTDVLALPSDVKVGVSKPVIAENKAVEVEVAMKPTVNAKPKEVEAVMKPTVNAKPQATNTLDYFTRQLELVDDILATPDERIAEPVQPVYDEPKQRTIARPAGKGRSKESMDMLDFFSSQLDSNDIFALPSDKKIYTPPVETLDLDYPQPIKVDTSLPPTKRKDSLWSSQGSSSSLDLNRIMDSPFTSTPKTQIWTRQTSRTTSERNASINSSRKNSGRNQTGSPTPSSSERARRIQSYNSDDSHLSLEQERRDVERDRIVKLETQAQQIIFEREEMEAEKARMQEEQRRFETEAQRIAEEMESMRVFVQNVERERQLDDENQEKKRRRVEAEEKARREAQEAREAQEVEIRRVQAEADAERMRIAAEQFARLEEEFAAEIEADREALRMEREREEEEFKRKQMFMAKEDRVARDEAERLTEMMRYDEQQNDTRRYEEEQSEERRYEIEEEERKRDMERQKDLDRQEFNEAQQRKRLAEMERAVTAKKRQEEEERFRYENRAAEEARAVEKERIDEQQKRDAEKRADQLFREEEERRSRDQEQERQIYEQEQATRQFQPQQSQTKSFGADRLADTYRLDLDNAGKPLLSPSVYEDEQYESEEEEREETKEEKLAKAEEKIRMAFAGLAEERGQQVPVYAAPVPVPVSVIPRSNTVRNERGPGGYGGFGGPKPSVMQESGVSRYNTTAGPRLQKREPPKVALSKVNTVSGRPDGRPFGLPSGPRGGGLPSGPRSMRR